MSRYTAAMICFGLISVITMMDFSWVNGLVAIGLLIAGGWELAIYFYDLSGRISKEEG